jgi:hypothetical protein
MVKQFGILSAKAIKDAYGEKSKIAMHRPYNWETDCYPLRRRDSMTATLTWSQKESDLALFLITLMEHAGLTHCNNDEEMDDRILSNKPHSLRFIVFQAVIGIYVHVRTKG